MPKQSTFDSTLRPGTAAAPFKGLMRPPTGVTTTTKKQRPRIPGSVNLNMAQRATSAVKGQELESKQVRRYQKIINKLQKLL